MGKCGMGCNAPARRGLWYCEGCYARWDREAENKRRKEVEAGQSAEIQKLRDEVAELKEKQHG